MLLVQDSLFTNAFQYASIGMALVDLDGRWLKVNPALCKLLGYSEEELLELTVHSVSLPQELQRDFRFVHKLIEGDISTYQVEKRYQHKEGYSVWAQLTLSIVRDAKNNPVSFIAQIQDISALKCKVEKLKKIEQVFDILSTYSQDIITFIGPDGTFEYVSPSVKGVLGFEPSDIVGRRSGDFVHHEDVDLLSKTILTPNAEAHTITYRSRHADGHYVWMETTIRTIRDKDGQIEKIFGIARNITERKEAEEILLHSEKLTLAGQLAAGIAHEIRNPLTAIKGFFQLMQSGMMKAAYYNVVDEEFGRIEMIINELLVLAKPQAASFANQDIAALLEHTATLLETQAILNNIQLNRSYQHASFMLACDGNQMKQVFINVLKNALEAMPDGGEIDIGLTVQRDNICIRFQDQGCGIPKDKVKRIGQPFFSLKEKGTGLGMMLSFKIIENHGGVLSIDSEIGKGTLVEISLPIQRR
ncbi:PAS domain-containing sensor histidine kinase [Paenibacillus soyae]|uniref:histidine kinase n=1 Tax=Paenibacillus soyae TaxID=2969249 RepID=A0A9X2MU72_9BACL|nr:PAS domain S-box protein [Paenibacillus soyae]MCR2807988.1 PAS domain S-box protein [Paenibacillus soyae]